MLCLDDGEGDEVAAAGGALGPGGPAGLHHAGAVRVVILYQQQLTTPYL